MTRSNDGLNLLDGIWVAGDGTPFHTTSPIDGHTTWRGAAASTEQATAAIDAAADAYQTWRRSTTNDRDAVVRRFADVAEKHAEELTNLISAEVGKTLADAASEVAAMIGKAETSIAARDQRTGTSTGDLAAGTLAVTHRPLGPTVVLGPFNFPAHLPNGHITPALLAGNTIVFKPSEQTPAIGQRMAELWVEAGLPPGVLNVVHGGIDVAEALIDHQSTASVLFTGGVNAGRAIHRRLAGRPDVMLALELGGNNPIIAWNVDDVASAASLVVRSAFLSAGQRCTCARRLIVSDNSDGQAIIDAVTDLTARLLVDAPTADPPPFLGPVISAQAAARILGAQRSLIGLGATPLVEAATQDRGPAYVSPGVLDVTGISDRPDEEIFGPILQIIRVADLDSAVAEANHTSFGLAAAVITSDDSIWATLEPLLDAGIVNRNVATVGASGAAPFGGIGASGNHRPAGFHAADYVAHPVASLAKPDLDHITPIVELSGQRPDEDNR